jgi:16S rRNA (cytosine967-C5)-methyltransferase
MHIALEIFCRAERDDRLVGSVMQARLRDAALDPARKARIREVVHGILRNLRLLDHLLQAHSKRPISRLERSVSWTLRIGAYRVLRQTAIPTARAVSETVGLLSSRKHARARGYVNAVLRSLCRNLDDLPLPDPETETIDHLSVLYSHPRWIVMRWIEEHGKERTIEALKAGCSPAPFTIRVNRLRTDRDTLLSHLADRGMPAVPGAHPESIRIEEGRSVLSIPEFDQGHFYVQDETAMEVVLAMDLAPGMRVLDLCASPGGKSTHMAEVMGDQGEILACDVSDAKLARITENCERLGIRCIETSRPDPAGLFDRILVDAPCSNSGVFRRRPEARWRLSAKSLAGLRSLQGDLLRRVTPHLAPDGMIVYSTCSIEPEECREVVGEVVAGIPHLDLIDDVLVLPRTDGPDGGYLARIQGGSGP